MHELGYLESYKKDFEGNLLITFKVDSEDTLIEKLQKAKDEQLVIDVKKFRKGRSLDANAYFWQLCDKMAKVLGSDKDTIYLMMLQGAGKFVDVGIVPDAYELLERTYRLCEKLYEYQQEQETAYGSVYVEMVMVRCYIGSHTYNTQEFAHLINYTVQQAKDLGIETLTPDELIRMMQVYAENHSKFRLKETEG